MTAQVALVTGGAQGIGRGIADGLVARGWHVVVCDRDETAGRSYLKAADAGKRLHFIQADVACEADVRAVLAEVLDWGGRLDVLINNAGLADPETGPIEALDLDVWQRKLDVNLTGPFLMSKHAVPHLRSSGGSIVNIASTRAQQSEPDCEAYAASKGGLVALTHALAISLGPAIRVNCISPGWIDVRAWQADAPETITPLSDTDHRQHPAGRAGTPEDVAALVAYLISSEAAFLTGQNLTLDGGMTRKMIYAD